MERARDMRTGGGSRGSFIAVVSAIGVFSFWFQGREIVSQPVEAALPLHPPGVDPLLGEVYRGVRVPSKGWLQRSQ